MSIFGGFSGGAGGLLSGLKAKLMGDAVGPANLGAYSGGDAGEGPLPAGAANMGGFSGGDAGVATAAASPRQGLGGLLDKIKTPDARGLTFGDKLFAAGSVLQGDSGGAATYLQNQRGLADKVAERDKATALSKRGAAAFRNNILGDGTFNFKGYADDLGDDLDPMAALKMRDATEPDYGVMSGQRGQLTAYNKRNPRDHYEVQPAGPAPESMFNDDGSINLNFIRARGILRDTEAAATAAHRAPPRARASAPSTGRPAGY